MARIKYDSTIMKYMPLFESMTGAKVKDCIVDDSVLFIVNEGEIGKAIGKGGSNIRRIEDLLKKRVRVVEFNTDVSKFVANIIHPFTVNDIKEEDGIVNIYANDTKTKGMIIGRERSRINSINEIVRRHFPGKEVKVV